MQKHTHNIVDNALQCIKIPNTGNERHGSDFHTKVSRSRKMLFQGVMFVHAKAKPRPSEMKRAIAKIKEQKCMARLDDGIDCQNDAVSIGRCEKCRQVLYNLTRGMTLDDSEAVKTKLVRAGELLPPGFRPERWGINTGNTTRMAAASVRQKATA